MPAGISTITMFAPVVASNAIFSYRRASKGVNSMEDNPVYGAMNMDIAAGQTLKGARAAKAISIASNPESKVVLDGAANSIKNLSQTSKVANAAGKVLNFTADHINPIICVTSGAKVLGSDDKADAAVREGLALGAMFTSEKAAKEFLGLSRKKVIDGKKVNVIGNGGIEKLLKEEQLNAVKDFCETKKLFNKVSLKMLPGTAKGLAFVSASIAGYKLGTELGNMILGKPAEVREAC